MDELSTLSPVAAGEGARLAREAMGGWAGAAQAGFADRLVDLGAYLDIVTFTATAGAGVIEEYSRQLGMLKGRLAAIDDHLAENRARVERGVEDAALRQARWAEDEHWTASRLAVLAEFDAASEELAQRLLALIGDIPDRPRRLGEHVSDAVTAVVEGVVDSAYLPFGWTWDPHGWASTVRGTPAAARDAATHPLTTLRESLPVDDVLAGKWGAAGGSLAVGFAGRNLGKVVKGVGDREHDWDRHLGPGGMPLPQSMPELLAGVDLERSDVFPGAHTIGRHVDVSDEFLKQRLEDGMMELGVAAKKPPTAASRWRDLETANEVITQTLRLNQDRIASKVAQGKDPIEISGPAPARAGVLWTRNDEGGFVQKPVGRCEVFLQRADDGSWFVVTAYLDAAS